MNISNNPYMKIERNLSLLLGIWPFQDSMRSWFHRLIVFIIMGSTAGFAVNGYISECASYDCFFEMTYLTATCIVIVSKYIAACYDKAELRRLYEIIERDWQALETTEERRLAEEVSAAGKRYKLYLARLICFCVWGYCLAPFSSVLLDIYVPLNESRPLQHMYKVEYFVDAHKYYYPIFLHLFLGTTTAVFTTIAIDSMYLGMLFHARALFRLTGYRLKIALSDTNTNDYIDARVKMTLRQIVLGVESHETAMKFSQKLFRVNEWPHLVVAIFGMIALSVSMYCTVAFFGEWKKVMMFVFGICGACFYAFMMMYPLQQMTDESARLFHEIYNSKWYATPLALQKCMLILMPRMMKPSKFIIYKMLEVSMETFSMIIQTCLSYCMVLCSIK